MNQDISLWTSVIIASLKMPRTSQQERHFTVSPFYKRVEDIKVRIRNPRTEQQGKSLETRMNLEIIVLLEETDGRTVLISRPEIVKERVSFGEFDRLPQLEEGEVEYITQIQDLNWDGELQDNEIVINYSLSYMIFAVREQMVRLFAEDEVKSSDLKPSLDLQETLEETSGEEKFRDDIKHQLFLYERDMLSLQRAIKKTEERNAVLNRELNGTQILVQTLREAITRKDLLICHYENQTYPAGGKPLPDMIGAQPKLGQRLRRMFMSSL